ncbi:uncharacterized [Tachysurus ichikawai]
MFRLGPISQTCLFVGSTVDDLTVRPSLQGDRSTTPLVCYCPYGNGPPSTPQTLPLPFPHTHSPGWFVFSSRSCERRVQSLLLLQHGVHVSEVWLCLPENRVVKDALIETVSPRAISFHGSKHEGQTEGKN